jgi:hypothetical protein
VRTTAQLKLFLDWFECVAPSLRGTTRLLNCTEGGARIEGMEQVPLARASDGWEPLAPIAPVLEHARAGIDPAARRRELRRWTQRTLEGLGECVRLARRCRMLAEHSPGDVHALGRLERKLARSLRSTPLVSLVAQDEIGLAREDARAAGTLAANLGAARRLYAVVEDAGQLLSEPLRAAGRALA